MDTNETTTPTHNGRGDGCPSHVEDCSPAYLCYACCLELQREADELQPWWLCQLCGFNAKTFEPSPAHQPGAMRFHTALHQSGRITPKGTPSA